MSTIAEDARALSELKDREFDAKEEYKALESQRKEAEADLIERMRNEEVDSIKTGGASFSPTATTYGQVQDRAQFIEWAKENDEELIEVKERKGLINELVRRHIEDGDPLPPGLGFYVREYISKRAA